MTRQICGVKRCRRVARQAFDMFDPWKARYVGIGKPHPDTPIRHYEVCDQHAEEFWPRDGYVERDHVEKIQKRVVPRTPLRTPSRAHTTQHKAP